MIHWMKSLALQKKVVNGCAVKIDGCTIFRSKAEDRLGIQLGRLQVPKQFIHPKGEK